MSSYKKVKKMRLLSKKNETAFFVLVLLPQALDNFWPPSDSYLYIQAVLWMPSGSLSKGQGCPLGVQRCHPTFI